MSFSQNECTNKVNNLISYYKKQKNFKAKINKIFPKDQVAFYRHRQQDVNF